MAIADAMTIKVVSVDPETSVQQAIARMIEANVGSVAVCEPGERLVGIFTERDVLRLAGEGRNFGERKISDVMTRALITVTPDEDILPVARLMGERRIRHLPVVEDGHLLGMVGIRDVLGALVERAWTHDETARDTAHELLRRPAAEREAR